jgi:hypothetical protein
MSMLGAAISERARATMASSSAARLAKWLKTVAGATSARAAICCADVWDIPRSP